MWETIANKVAEYGPFPFGIIVGIYIKELAEKKVYELMKQEREAHKEEKKELTALLKAQQGRIDILHKELYPSKPRREP